MRHSGLASFASNFCHSLATFTWLFQILCIALDSLLRDSVFKTRCTSQITTTSCATCIGCAPKYRHIGTREVLLPDRTNSTRTLPGFVLSFDVVVDGKNERKNNRWESFSLILVVLPHVQATWYSYFCICMVDGCFISGEPRTDQPMRN